MSVNFFTLPLKNTEGTITYVIDHEFNAPDGKRLAFLNHPNLAPNAYIKIEADSFEALQGQQVQTQGKSDTHKQLDFLRKFQEYLSYEETLRLESLCEAFVINRCLSKEQKKLLSDLCGKVAQIHLNDDINLAIRKINENAALLDNFNMNWYYNLKSYFSGKKKIDSRGKRLTIFNMAGFILAQLENV